MRVIPLVLGVAFGPPASADWAHCYTGAAPGGVAAHPDAGRLEALVETAAEIVVIKAACGVPVRPEAAGLRRLVAQEMGCAATSDLARDLEELLAASPAQATQALGIRPGLLEMPEFQSLCRAVREAPAHRPGDPIAASIGAALADLCTAVRAHGDHD